MRELRTWEKKIYPPFQGEGWEGMGLVCNGENGF
jgi:hypothetical protein